MKWREGGVDKGRERWMKWREGGVDKGRERWMKCYHTTHAHHTYIVTDLSQTGSRW